MPNLPDNLYGRICTLGYYSCPHEAIPEQSAAKANLHFVLHREPVEKLPDALRRFGYAWVKNVQGNYIEGENWFTDNAYQLAREVEFYISSSRQLAA